MDYDVIIIGAGMSGIAAGIRLAHFGKKVVICERHSLVGGLNSYYRRHGRDFDVGLHAMTNYADPKLRSAPLNRLLRQLRIDHASLRLQPQGFSLVRFPQAELRFSNRFTELEQSVERIFPGEAAGFRRLVARVRNEDAFALRDSGLQARPVLHEFIRDPLLVDMLLCPLMYYGSAAPGDMEFTQFCIMFHSIYLEGFSRPEDGIRPFLNLLLERYREGGGELRLKCGVSRIQGRAGGGKTVTLDDGTSVSARAVLSSAGYIETLQLCSPEPAEAKRHPRGELGFVETILVLDRPPAGFGFEASILFFNDADTFRFQRPARLVDPHSGVVCAQDNFAAAAGGTHAGESILRITQLADYEPWFRMDDDEYDESKEQVLAEQVRLAERFLPGVGGHIVCTDMFTPRTIGRFTGHVNGALYGSPAKTKSGLLPVPDVYLCGTDQGFLGITGAMLSGVSIANQYLLK